MTLSRMARDAHGCTFGVAPASKYLAGMLIPDAADPELGSLRVVAE